MSKPLTKALHTRRVVQRLARMIALRRQLRTDCPSDHIESIWREVLWILGNDEPTDARLLEDCKQDVCWAIAETSRELTEREAARIINAPIRTAGRAA